MHDEILIDLTDVPACACNHGIDALHKALAESPDESLLWRPHENPLLAGICEAFTLDAQARVQGAQDALLGALGIETDAPVLRKADAWPPDKIQATALDLQKPLNQYSPSDWLALVDLSLHTHFHQERLHARATWLAFRATLAGRMQPLFERAPETAAIRQSLLDVLGKIRFAIQPPLTLMQHRAWEWAKARIGIHLTAITDACRARISSTIATHIMEHGLAARGKLEQSLRDDFGALNRDWRRVAITEAGEVANQAYLGEIPTGARVQRIEAYEGACPFCAKLNGRVFTWSDVPLDDSQGWTHIWPGKTNDGRAMSARKRTDDGLVDRTESELWWPAAGLQHPNCRGRWLALPDEAIPAGMNPDFHAWLQDELAQIKP